MRRWTQGVDVRSYGRSEEARAHAGSARSKSMLNSVTAQHAHALVDTNVIVNTACPGYVATNFTGSTRPEHPSKER